MLSGVIGLFVGAVVLALGYRVFGVFLTNDAVQKKGADLTPAASGGDCDLKISSSFGCADLIGNF